MRRIALARILAVGTWTVEDGLPLSMVWVLEQARDGILWVGTAEFKNLDAGTHRFEVQATINGETWYRLA